MKYFSFAASYIQVCGRRNPKLDECIKNSVENIKETLTKGIPEIDVPPINPLYVQNVRLAELPNFKARANYVTIYGFEGYQIDHLHVNLEKQLVDLIVTFDKLHMKSDYHVKAKIIVNIDGHGTIETETEKIKANITIYYKIVEREKKNYMYFYSMRIKLDVKDYTATFNATDGMDKTLMTAINAALQNSKPEILQGTIPNLEKRISQEVLDIGNKIGSHFTYEELFPDTE